MNNIEVICFSPKKDYLDWLATETEMYFGNISVQNRFQNREDLLQFLSSSQLNSKVLFILLDTPELDNATLQFFDSINKLATNSVKLVIAESNHLVAIQEQIGDPESFCFMNYLNSATDFKLAFFKLKSSHSKLQLQQKCKEESDKFNTEKKQKLSVIAHDLKSPFTALLGISEILISDWHELSDDEKLELVKGMKSTSENAYEMVEKLLNESNTPPKD